MAEETRFELLVGCPTAVFERDAEWTPVDSGGRNPPTDVQNDDPGVQRSPTAVQEVHQDEGLRRELRRWRDVVVGAIVLAETGDPEGALAMLHELVRNTREPQ